MAEGLRERKKRLTRQRIAETGAALFVERGFDNVTIAEVAAAADVSVNTVYNYFEAKEDLVLPPDQASPDRLAAIVRERRIGESAAVAVLRRLREELHRHDRALGLAEGFGRFLEMVNAAPTLVARFQDLHLQMVAALTEELAGEVGAGPGDPVPALVAGQIGWLHAHVLAESGRRALAGHAPAETAASLLALLDEAESLLGERTLTYATRRRTTMTVPAFRVTVRGKFRDLPEESRATLRAAADAYETAFTEEGTFSPDATLSVFSFRVQIPAGPDDDEDDAVLRALEILEGHGHPHEVLRTAVTDLRDIKIRRKRR